MPNATATDLEKDQHTDQDGSSIAVAPPPAKSDPAPAPPVVDGGNEKVTITFQGDAARAVRAMAAAEHTTPTELARRSLFLMDVYLQLDEDQELVVQDGKGRIAKLMFPWRYFSARH